VSQWANGMDEFDLWIHIATHLIGRKNGWMVWEELVENHKF